MKNLLLVLFNLLLIVEREELTIKGFYNGKNIYVQNPFSANHKDFCIEKIYINSTLKTNKPLTSAVLIDLSHLNIQEPVEIKIIHNKGCKPQVINPEALEKKDQFIFTSIQVNQHYLQWKSKNEKVAGNFIVEIFVKDNWQEVGELPGKGLRQETRYSFPSYPRNGNNRYRVKFIEKEGRTFYSNEVELEFTINDEK